MTRKKFSVVLLLLLVSITPQLVLAQETFTGNDELVNILAADSEPPTCNIIFTPDSIPLGPYDISPAFGPAVREFTTEYKDFGVIFGSMRYEDIPVAVFSDPPNSWAGVNSNGDVDLLTSVVGSIVYPGTTKPATTSFLRVEAGYASVGNLLLEVFDRNGILIASTINDDGFGNHGRTLMIISEPGIRYFRISGNDTYGVNEIQLCTPILVTRSVGGLLLEPNTLGMTTPLVSLFMVAASILAGAIFISRHKEYVKRF